MRKFLNICISHIDFLWFSYVTYNKYFVLLFSLLLVIIINKDTIFAHLITLKIVYMTNCFIIPAYKIIKKLKINVF